MAEWTIQTPIVSIWRSTSQEESLAYQDNGESYAYGDNGETIGVDVTLGGTASTGANILGLDEDAA